MAGKSPYLYLLNMCICMCVPWCVATQHMYMHVMCSSYIVNCTKSLFLIGLFYFDGTNGRSIKLHFGVFKDHKHTHTQNHSVFCDIRPCS